MWVCFLLMFEITYLKYKNHVVLLLSAVQHVAAGFLIPLPSILNNCHGAFVISVFGDSLHWSRSAK